MLSRSLILAVLLSIASAVAQSAGPSVTVTSSKQINLPIEQANLDVVVGSGLSTTLDQVLPVVQSLGLTAKDLAGLSTLAPAAWFQTNQPVLWRFRLVRSFAQLPQALAELQSWSNNVDQKFTGTFSLASFTTTEATARQLADAALPGLIADARAKAQHLADASGLTVGTILSLAAASTPPPVQFSVAPAAAVFLSPGTGIPAVLPTPITIQRLISPTSTASVTIRFALLRYSNPF